MISHYALALSDAKTMAAAARAEAERNGWTMVIAIVDKLIKQRKDSVEMFRQGNRPELADKEEAEIKLIEAYLPAAPSGDEVNAAIEAAIAETGRGRGTGTDGSIFILKKSQKSQKSM